MSDLADLLKVLLAHAGCPANEFHKRLLRHLGPGETIGYTTLTEALKGDWPPRKGAVIERVMRAYAQELGVDLARLAHDQRSVTRNRTEPTGRNLPEYLKGAWLLIQYRGKRKRINDDHADNDVRVAVLIYGDDTTKGARSIKIIGLSTIWNGSVEAHPRDDLLTYSASEIRRTDIEESIHMVMHTTYGGGTIADHSGIILGIGRGESDVPHYPIYASRVLLWRIKNEKERQMTVSVEDAEIERLKQYCGYFPFPTGTVPSAENHDPLINERTEAIDRFADRQGRQGNYGDRIFVRF